MLDKHKKRILNSTQHGCSIVTLIYGGPLCINDGAILLPIGLPISLLVGSTLLRWPLKASKTIKGVLCLLLRLLLRLLLPGCSLHSEQCKILAAERRLLAVLLSHTHFARNGVHSTRLYCGLNASLCCDMASHHCFHIRTEHTYKTHCHAEGCSTE